MEHKIHVLIHQEYESQPSPWPPMVRRGARWCPGSWPLKPSVPVTPDSAFSFPSLVPVPVVIKLKSSTTGVILACSRNYRFISFF